MNISRTLFTKEKLPYLLFSTFFAALGLRLIFFLVSCLFVEPTGDEGLLMLQAKHIWQGKEVPLLFWAQPYTFPLESYLNAPLTAFLPSNAFGARFLAWFWGLASCLLALAIVRRMGTLREVWPAYLLVLFPSAYWLMMQSAYAPPSYPSYLGLYFLAILCARISQDAPSISMNLLLVALSGFFAGLACSITLLAAPLVAGLGLFFLMRGNFGASLRQGGVFGLSVIVGLVPQIMARVMIPGAYAAVSGNRSLPDALVTIWKTAIQWTLSGSFGIRYPFFPDLTLVDPGSSVTGFADVFPFIWLVIFSAVIIIGCWRLVSARKGGWLNLDFVHVFSVTTVLAIVLFGLSERAFSHSYRYLLPVVMSFPFQVAYLYRYANRLVRFFLGGLVLFLVCINIVHSVNLIRMWRTPDFGRTAADLPSLQPVIDFLDKNDIRFAYGSWFSAHRLTYATDERIISGQYYNERFYGWPTPYKKMIDSEKKVAFILDPTRKLSPENFEREMTRVFPGVTYRKSTAGYYTIYCDFYHLPKMLDAQVDPDEISVQASHNPHLVYALQDQDPINRWYTGDKQEEGMFLDVFLAHEQPITQINLYYNTHHRGQAKELHISAEKDGAMVKLKALVEKGGRQLVMVEEDVQRNASFIEMKNGHPVVGDVHSGNTCSGDHNSKTAY